ncbi:MAG: pro-sigmaK processing inhibitor BofA family protein [Methanosarcina sp.]
MAFAVIEISTLVMAIIIGVVLYIILKNGTQLAMNAVFGLLVLIAAKFLFGFNIAINLLTVLICAIGGVFGAILIIILNYLDIAFV